MTEFSFHDDPETVEELRSELPEAVPWGQYLLECVQLRKRVESREVVLCHPDTRSVEEKRYEEGP